ncbi:hypothetical protein QN277_018510 [Acacia crassicarpa]|uniref:Pre-rRNA-processing protein Ipi1 N-terminal domain-containing protein n=1 Tax=Acacia crassicarpa TaxID=499986 RepID=A0AAE1MRL8_9FABA|nr:hypothetical protein QN277_018510 [Acacia crassicarpa]
MTRFKAPSKKKHGVDFKKIKRKIGRKLPPPKNSTNTEIKSKAIILPEQSVASEKAGLAVNKKGLTLKELLQQTSHHNQKVRRDALAGIKELLIKHPTELKLHKYAVVEKLRERILDDVKVVRDSLYDLFKLVILPGCEEDNQELVVSLLMAYGFKAMTYLSFDIRLKAFEFLDLVLEFYPPSLPLYAEKIFQNYADILRNNQCYFQDKGKLKVVLVGLVRCLSLLPWNKRETDLHDKNDTGQRVLHAFEDDMPARSTGFPLIIKKLKDLVPILLNSFREFIPQAHASPKLDGTSSSCMLSILNCIDMIIRSFTYDSNGELSESQSSLGDLGMMIGDEAISSLMSRKLFSLFPLNPVHDHSEKEYDKYLELNMVVTKVFFQLNEWICLPPDLLGKFLEFLENALLGKVCQASLSAHAVWEKHLIQLLPFIPKIVTYEANYWTPCLLQAFTQTFKESKPASLLKIACLSAIEHMLTSITEKILQEQTSNLEILEFQDAFSAWIRELPLLLIQVGDKHPAFSQAVLRLQLRIGQRGLFNSSLVRIYDDLQFSLREFYCTCEEGIMCYGPFIRLPREVQELSLCCLYYVSHLDSDFLKTMSRCCLCPNLDPHMLSWVIEVLHSAYRAGHIDIADHLSFCVTLLSSFKVSHEVVPPGLANDPSFKTFKSITRFICRQLTMMGDNSLVLELLEEVILDQILLKPPLDNSCSLLTVLVTLDDKPTMLSEKTIDTLGGYLLQYLMDVVQCIPEDDDKHTQSNQLRTLRFYYLVPCFFLFDRCHKLMNLVLKSMRSTLEGSFSAISDSCIQSRKAFYNRVNAVAFLLSLMHKDSKLQRIVSLFKADIDNVLQFYWQLLENASVGIEERDKIHRSVDELKILRSSLP